VTAGGSGALAAIAGGLVVSCQAPPGHPLSTPSVIARLARCAVLGGAAGVRINDPRNVAAVRAAGVEVPLIGLHKVLVDRFRITTTARQARRLVAAGADIVAVEVTAQAGLERCLDLVGELSADGVTVMADVSTHAEGARAWERGAAVVGTTLSGYTPASAAGPDDGPDVGLVGELSADGIATIAEGRYRDAAQLAAAFAAGAVAVVVGTAITDPVAITRAFADGMRRRP